MNLVNGKTYVGQTTTCKEYEDHFGCNTYYGSGVDLLKDIKKYSKEAFVRHTIETVEGGQETLNNRETYWIKELKPSYNKNNGACGSGIRSEETKKLISEKCKGISYYNIWLEKYGKEEADRRQKLRSNKISKSNKGRKIIWKEKIGKSNKGKKRTEEMKQKYSKVNKGIIPWNKGLTKETDSRMKKLSESLKGRKKNRNK